MTPVPPMPVTTRLNGLVRLGTGGCGRARHQLGHVLLRLVLAKLPALDRHEAGAEPLLQEKSLLQLDWLMWRLRPNSVSIGSTEMQLDCTLQSPQPSHTRSLMNRRCCGSGKVPRFAPAALFGGAGLVIDDDGDALDVAELDLQRLHLIAVMDGGAGGEADA